MPLLRQFWTNFTGGELDPLLSSRVDTHAYANGAKTLRNLRIMAQGGVKRRPGTKYLATLTGTSFQMEPFVFSDDQTYFFIFTASNLAVYNGATGASTTTVGSCPWTSAMIGDLVVAQTANTMIVSHPDLQTQKILRTGASTFTVGNFGFTTKDDLVHQPYHKFEADSLTMNADNTATGSRTITASSSFFTSDHVGMQFRIQGKQVSITAVASGTSATGNVREALPNTTPDSDWEEPAMSATRGWARTCCFHSGRLVFGGSRDLPNWVFTSKTAEYFNFDEGEAEDTDSIQVQILEQQVSEITAVISFRHLLVFTDNSEIFSPTTATSPLTPGNVSFRRQTKYGTTRIQPKEFDEAIIFLSKGKKSVREFEYDDIKQAYLSPSISLLSGHLITTPIDLEIQTENDEGQESYAYIVNSDGTLAVYMAMRNEKISSWGKWTTNGKFKNLVSLNGLVYAIVERELPLQATCTITVSDYANISTGSEISLIKNDGTAITFTSTTGTASTNEFKTETNNNTTATNLRNTINGHSDFSAAVSSAVVTVTRNDVGNNNLTVTSADTTRLTVTNFTGGSEIKYYLEVFDSTLTLDSSETLTSGSATATWTGLDHLDNCPIKIVTGNYSLGDATVDASGGVSTSPDTFTTITAGFDYTPSITTLAPELQIEGGTSAGVFRRVVRTVLDVNESLDVSAEGTKLLIRNVNDDLSTEPDKVTGRKEFWVLGWDRRGEVDITQTEPLPLTLNGVMVELEF